MTELIDRQAAIKAIHEEFDECLVWDESGQHTADEVESILTSLPFADVVEVVRCRDCKWFGEIGCAIKIVDETDKPHEEDFCSFAERR